ncbi:hypothetical protein CSL55_13230, partial [Salmonella enterica subsp. diarizonae]|nr:hypothetical protein [Salmonella enterica subsp. diarizonae]
MAGLPYCPVISPVTTSESHPTPLIYIHHRPCPSRAWPFSFISTESGGSSWDSMCISLNVRLTPPAGSRMRPS